MRDSRLREPTRPFNSAVLTARTPTKSKTRPRQQNVSPPLLKFDAATAAGDQKLLMRRGPLARGADLTEGWCADRRTDRSNGERELVVAKMVEESCGSGEDATECMVDCTHRAATRGQWRFRRGTATWEGGLGGAEVETEAAERPASTRLVAPSQGLVTTLQQSGMSQSAAGACLDHQLVRAASESAATALGAGPGVAQVPSEGLDDEPSWLVEAERQLRGDQVAGGLTPVVTGAGRRDSGGLMAGRGRAGGRGGRGRGGAAGGRTGEQIAAERWLRSATEAATLLQRWAQREALGRRYGEQAEWLRAVRRQARMRGRRLAGAARQLATLAAAHEARLVWLVGSAGWAATRLQRAWARRWGVGRVARRAEEALEVGELQLMRLARVREAVTSATVPAEVVQAALRRRRSAKGMPSTRGLGEQAASRDDAEWLLIPAERWDRRKCAVAEAVETARRRAAVRLATVMQRAWRKRQHIRAARLAQAVRERTASALAEMEARARAAERRSIQLERQLADVEVGTRAIQATLAELEVELQAALEAATASAMPGAAAVGTAAAETQTEVDAGPPKVEPSLAQAEMVERAERAAVRIEQLAEEGERRAAEYRELTEAATRTGGRQVRKARVRAQAAAAGCSVVDWMQVREAQRQLMEAVGGGELAPQRLEERLGWARDQYAQQQGLLR